MFTNKNLPEQFSFAPGSAPGKLSGVNFEGLKNLSFFDVPVDNQGYLSTDSNGYQNFKYNSADLISKAHAYSTKVLLTVSQGNNATIQEFLDSDTAQTNLIQEGIQEVKDNQIDGITLTFEYHGNPGVHYRTRFSRFVKIFAEQLHSQIPGSRLAVSMDDNSLQNSLYDITALSNSADKIFITANDYAAVEYKAQANISPVYGYDPNSYWNDISKKISGFLKYTKVDKLAVERAWYGSGDDYPMYVPNSEHKQLKASNATIPQDLLDRLVSDVPDSAKEAARHNIPYIVKALDAEGILNANVLSYALATIEHETAGTFEPLEEIQGKFSARRLGYEGGAYYDGRGFIQLTHLRNYRMVGERIGMGDQLARHPELASTPEVAAKVLAAFFADNNVANLASQGSYVAARAPINPDYNGWSVARLAYKYEGDF